MTRLFHGFACALFLAALWFNFLHPSTQPPSKDPRARLIELMTEAGLVYSAQRAMVGAETALSFSQSGCAWPTEILYLPTVNHISPIAMAKIDTAKARSLIVYDGEVVAGLGSGDIMPRWLWRKLLIAFNLKPPDPWTSIILVALVPPGCEAPRVDWMRLIDLS